jgi:hypothetical protein
LTALLFVTISTLQSITRLEEEDRRRKPRLEKIEAHIEKENVRHKRPCIQITKAENDKMNHIFFLADHCLRGAF